MKHEITSMDCVNGATVCLIVTNVFGWVVKKKYPVLGATVALTAYLAAGACSVAGIVQAFRGK